MKKMRPGAQRQAGATIIEFSLVLIVFLTFFLGILDLSRMLFSWGAANEATRAGARYAVVCDDTTRSAAVLARMQALLPQIQSIQVTWSPANCTPANCTGVAVRVTSLNYQWISPIGGALAMSPIPMPAFSTYLPREVMRQDPNNHSDALCAL
jgi:Flp pilus assembly protein TadG